MRRIVPPSPVLLVVLLGLCSYARQAHARIISIDFTARVTEAVEGFLIKTPLRDLKVGDVIAGTYVYDSTTPDSSVLPNVGLYEQTTGTFRSAIHFSQRTLVLDPTTPHIGQVAFTSRLEDNPPSESGGDSYIFEVRQMTSDRTGFIMLWNFRDDTGQALSSTALPTTLPPLEAFQDQKDLFVGTVGEFSTFRILATILSVRLTPATPPRPTCDRLDATIVGTPGDDILQGTEGDDVIVGLGGNDVIEGRGGNDVLCGGEGNDVLLGGPGHDRLFGDAGEDLLDGDAGDDRLFGGAGRDWLLGGPGDDYLLGEAENDGLEGGEGNDALDGGIGDDILDGDAGRDRLTGGDGHDWLRGGAGDDLLLGGEGDDGLEGNEDVDRCFGEQHVIGDLADATCESISEVP